MSKQIFSVSVFIFICWSLIESQGQIQMTWKFRFFLNFIDDFPDFLTKIPNLNLWNHNFHMICICPSTKVADRPFQLEDTILILKLLANQTPFLSLHNLCKWGVNITSYKGF